MSDERNHEMASATIALLAECVQMPTQEGWLDAIMRHIIDKDPNDEELFCVAYALCNAGGVILRDGDTDPDAMVALEPLVATARPTIGLQFFAAAANSDSPMAFALWSAAGDEAGAEIVVHSLGLAVALYRSAVIGGAP